jgi:hypothetical protein
MYPIVDAGAELRKLQTTPTTVLGNKGANKLWMRSNQLLVGSEINPCGDLFELMRWTPLTGGLTQYVLRRTFAACPNHA